MVQSTLKIFISGLNPTILAGKKKQIQCRCYDLLDEYNVRRFSVPVLWDKKNHTIVNNESSEIIRIFNAAFNDFIPEDKATLDLYPQEHRAEIDSINEWVYDFVNSGYCIIILCRVVLINALDGVYKAGVAVKQQAYEAAVVPLFDSLDRLEKMLTGKDHLVGDTLTEADVRLWVTIVGLIINDLVSLLIYTWVSLGRFVSIPSISATSSATSAPSEMGTLLSIRASFQLCNCVFGAHTCLATAG